MILFQSLAQSKEQHRLASVNISDKSRHLQQLTEDIDNVKSEMEERGSSMTDGSPLVNIEKAVSRVRREILDMDVMIGVLQQGLMQDRVKGPNYGD